MFSGDNLGCFFCDQGNFLDGSRRINLLQTAVNMRQSNRRFVVRAAAKDIAFDQKSRAAMQAGIDKLADVVGLTLGPRGILFFISCFGG